jgi:hypothetical protein
MGKKNNRRKKRADLSAQDRPPLHQNETEGVEQTEAAIQQSISPVVEAIVEHDNVGARNGNELSPGKDFKLIEGAVSEIIGHYSREITGQWLRFVDDGMKTARLCADAAARLKPDARKLLRLPFGEVTFSKLVQIGKDARLRSPEVQNLLPPHYTIVYEITKLESDELRLAIDEGVIRPEMKRAELQKWLAQRQVGGVDENEEPTSDFDSQSSDTSASAKEEPQDHPEPHDEDAMESSTTIIQLEPGALELTNDADVAEVVSPPTTPATEVETSSDHAGLSPEEQRDLDELMTLWDALTAKYRAVCTNVQGQFQAAVKFNEGPIANYGSMAEQNRNRTSLAMPSISNSRRERPSAAKL